MDPIHSLALHFAVWDDDLDHLAKLLAESKHVSLGSGHTRAAHMLLAAGAYPTARTPDGWEAVQVASATCNTDLTRVAVMAMLREMDVSWERRVPILVRALNNMPDFVMRMQWTFSSWIPFVSSLLPNDTVTVSKRGSAMRIDCTLLGTSGASWKRGSISILIQGEEQGNPGAMLVMDNEERTADNLRLAFTNPKDEQVQDWVRKLLTKEQKVSDWWTRDVSLEQEMQRGWFGVGTTDNIRTETVGPWPGCSVYALRGLQLRERAHGPILRDLPLESWWRREYSQAERRLRGHESCPGILALEGVGGWAKDAAWGVPVGAEGGTTGADTPVEHDAPLEDEWQPREAPAAAAAGVGGGSGASSGPLSLQQESYGSVETPDEGMRPLARLLHRLQGAEEVGVAADSVTELELEELEGIGRAAQVGSTLKVLSFDDYFEEKTEGFVDPRDTEHNNRGAPGRVFVQGAAGSDAVKRLAHQLEQEGSEIAARVKETVGGTARKDAGQEEEDAAAAKKEIDDLAEAGTEGSRATKERPEAAAVADIYAENVRESFKGMNATVNFSRDFPLRISDMISIAEVMARTGYHFENFRRFFNTKLPQDEGFPVRFQIPVFPTITASILFQSCELITPDASLFRVPDDVELGAYVERGFIRQL